MLKHLPLALITIFWLVMNYLLWQRDFRAADIAGGKVPLNLVWTKMLRSADDSFLYIFHKNRRIGDLRWSTDVVDFIAQNPEELKEGAEVDLSEEDSIFMTEGMVLSPGNYNVEIRAGRVMLGKPYGQVNFEMLANFSTNNTWSSLEMSFRQKNKYLQFQANATNETIAVKFLDGDVEFIRELSFDDASSRNTLAAALVGNSPALGFAGGLLTGMIAPENPAFGAEQLAKMAINTFEARQDWLHVGHSRLRVYRISIKLPENKEIAIFISRAGEIMRILAPNGIELRNNRLLLL